MVKVQIAPYRLLLRNPFTLAHGSSQWRENVFICIETDGNIAYGEAPVVPYYGISGNAIMEDLRNGISVGMIKKHHIHGVRNQFKYSMSAFAYTTAILSLKEQMMGEGPDLEPLEAPIPQGVKASSFTIAYDSDMDHTLKHIDSCGFSTIKVKAGFPDDLERIKKIRQHFPHIAIRLDANQGWTFEQAYRMVNEIADLSIELIEEPIVGTAEELYTLRERSPVPILLDETVQSPEDLDHYVGSIDGIVVKLAKSGGPQEAWRMIHEARKYNLSVMLSSMVESSLGVSAALLLAPLCRWIDLDAPLLSANDPFLGLTYVQGVPTGHLSALVPTQTFLEALSRGETLLLEA